jgi:hypothetical protein
MPIHAGFKRSVEIELVEQALESVRYELSRVPGQQSKIADISDPVCLREDDVSYRSKIKRLSHSRLCKPVEA